jgi:hypothetical protein
MPHFGPTRRESEWRAHCVVAAALIGISHHRVTIGVELVCVQVAVRVDPHRT